MAEALASLREVGDVSCHPTFWPAAWLEHDWVLGLAFCNLRCTTAALEAGRPTNSQLAASSFLTINPDEVDAVGHIH